MNTIKSVLAVFTGGVAALVKVLTVPVLLLASCNIIDYTTGLMAAGFQKRKNSPYKSVRGIAKKICLWLLVLIGAVVDELLSYASDVVGMKLPFAFLVSCVVCLWLVCSEILSILKNISEIGVPLPPFLKKIVKLIKKNIEDAAKVEKGQLEEQENKAQEEKQEEQAEKVQEEKEEGQAEKVQEEKKAGENRREDLEKEEQTGQQPEREKQADGKDGEGT